MSEKKRSIQEKLIVGERVKTLRERKGFTLKELATKVKLSIGFIGDIEAGRGKPSLVTLNKLAQALETTTDYLLGRTNDPTPPSKVDEEKKSLHSLLGDPAFTDLLMRVQDLTEEEKESLAEHWEIVLRVIEEKRKKKLQEKTDGTK